MSGAGMHGMIVIIQPCARNTILVLNKSDVLPQLGRISANNEDFVDKNYFHLNDKHLTK